MALLFNANAERVTHSAAASINSLDAQTWVFWYYYNGSPPGSARLFYKGSVQVWIGNGGAATDSIRYFRARATTGTELTPSTTLTSNAWNYVAIVEDDGVTPHVYFGSVSSAATEVSYSAQVTGVGAPNDDSGSNLDIGGRSSANAYAQGSIALVGIWSRVLTLPEINAQRAMLVPMNTNGLALFANYGWNGVGAQPDWSGNLNNGTVTGATVANHAPVGWSAPIVSFLEPPAAGLSIPVAMHHYQQQRQSQ